VQAATVGRLTTVLSGSINSDSIHAVEHRIRSAKEDLSAWVAQVSRRPLVGKKLRPPRPGVGFFSGSGTHLGAEPPSFYCYGVTLVRETRIRAGGKVLSRHRIYLC